jgi:hypothetical protein
VGSTNHLRGGQLLKMDKFTKHPSFDDEILDYDFGVVHFLNDEIVPGLKVGVIKLATSEHVEGEMTVAGWGVTHVSLHRIRNKSEVIALFYKETDDESSKTLREVIIYTLTYESCLNTYDFITDRQFCSQRTDPCNVSSFKDVFDFSLLNICRAILEVPLYRMMSNMGLCRELVCLGAKPGRCLRFFRKCLRSSDGSLI